MEVRQLKYFVAVLKRSSFSLAAEDLNVTQPALSKSLRSLEQSLGVKLVERGPNGVSPTVFGDQLFLYAHPILSMLDEAREEIASMKGASKGQLRVGAVPSALLVMVPTTVREFLVGRADVRLSVQEGLSDALVNGVRNGTLDLAVCVLPTEKFPAEIGYHVLQEDRIGVVCRRGHPLTQLAAPSLSDLTDFEWVVPEKQEPDRRQLDRMFVSRQLPKPRIAMETTSVTVLSPLLSSADYLSYLPASSVSDTGSLVMLPLSDDTWTRTTVVAFRERGPARPLSTVFLRTLGNVARRLVDIEPRGS